MTTVTETPAQPAAKRTRISNDVEIIETASADCSASKAARIATQAAVASHPRAIQKIALEQLKQLIKLQGSVMSNLKTIETYSDEAQIPGSANVKFDLKQIPEVMETTKFKAQDTIMAEATRTFKDTARKSVVVATQERLAYDKKKVQELLIESIRRLCRMVLVENKPRDKNPPIVKFAYYASQKLEAQIYILCAATSHDTSTHFLKEHNTALEKAEGAALEWASGEQDRFQQLTARLQPILKAIFIDGYNAYKSKRDENDIEAALERAAKEILTGKSAEKTQMEVDAEQSIPASKIKEYIDERVDKRDKQRQKQIDRLQQQLERSKNSSRGAPKSASSPKKNNTTTKTNKKAANGPKSPKAANKKGNERSRGRNAKDSPNEKSKWKKNAGQKSKRRRGNNTRRG